MLNYTQALGTALSMIKKGIPISNRVILVAHKTLMESANINKSHPGHYRQQSVRVSDLVPPPAQRIPQLMAELEQFINTDNTLPSLIKAGLAHVQFETIHPFLDGNGRIGRLLIVSMFFAESLLSEPIFYPSYYFKKHKAEYYQRLDRVRTHGDFEGWISFYLTAIKESSIDAYRRAKDIDALWEYVSSTLKKQHMPAKKSQTRYAALSLLFNHPIISVTELSKQLAVSYNTAHAIVNDFIAQGILVQETQQKRGKLYRFKPYMTILEREY